MRRPLPKEYIESMRGLLGEDGLNAYLAAMKQPQKRALRVNTLKTSAEEFRKKADFPLESVGLVPDSFFFDDDVPIGKHPLHAAGFCYVQEPSAQVPASLLDVRPGMAVLDLCAAPGGKATQLAALMQNQGLLVVNEAIRSRTEALLGNIERLGVTNALVVSVRPDALEDPLCGLFDRVLVDAPCSGEGMFRKDDIAVGVWSPEHVTSCAIRQWEILHSAAQMLKPGGRLVYSTCTFSKEENEGVIQTFFETHSGFSQIETRRLYPHSSVGEGQFMAVLERTRDDAPPAEQLVETLLEHLPAWDLFWQSTFFGEPPGVFTVHDGRVFLPPETLPAKVSRMHVLRAGVLAGEMDYRAGRFTPAHALAMAYPAAAFQRTVPLEGEPLVRFFSGETVPCDPALSGWCAVTALGWPIGWGKAVQGVLKNHIPKGLRFYS
ncbi:MAG TPA: RsmB/NOP family class I SAM-dependent RNA methyltransferase [Feifaniaceae bacterium]|nr:RsmB/NOP family class I SAM-dependent RNA methyltransferase [Feifaniaceae bacterium]